MKKIVSVISAVMLFMLSASPCFAQETTPDDDVEISVTAEYVYNENVYTSTPEDGKYIVITDDGETVIVEPKSSMDTEIVMIVRQILKTETDAYNWVTESLSEKGKNPLAYEIYFLDKQGNRVEPLDGMSVDISLPTSYNVYVACSISKDGTATQLTHKLSDGHILFDVSQSGYIALGEKPDESQGQAPADDEKQDSSSSNNSNDSSSSSQGGSLISPNTGYDSQMLVCILLLISALGIAVYRARKSNGKESE